jgi:hypothetical protein
MKSEIKPFCVATNKEDLTREQIKQLYSWCLEAGAGIWHELEEWLETRDGYPLMGIAEDGETRCHYDKMFFEDNIIPFSEVRKHLGLDTSNSDTEAISEELPVSVDDCVPESEQPSEPSVQALYDCASLMSSEVISAIKKYSLTLETTVDNEGLIHHTVYHNNIDDTFKVHSLEEFRELLKGFETLDKFKGE